MNSREDIEIVNQWVFGDGGEIEADGGQVETTFRDWGLVTDTQERETRIEEAAASEFGIDDRAMDDKEFGETEQGSLFTDVEEDQQTLSGEAAAGKSKWD